MMCMSLAAVATLADLWSPDWYVSVTWLPLLLHRKQEQAGLSLVENAMFRLGLAWLRPWQPRADCMRTGEIKSKAKEAASLADAPPLRPRRARSSPTTFRCTTS